MGKWHIFHSVSIFLFLEAAILFAPIYTFTDLPLYSYHKFPEIQHSSVVREISIAENSVFEGALHWIGLIVSVLLSCWIYLFTFKVTKVKIKRGIILVCLNFVVFLFLQ